MSVLIEIPKELEERLTTQASRLNLSVTEYALRILEEKSSDEPKQPATGRDLVQYWLEHGLIGTRTGAESTEEISRRLRHTAEHRSR